MTLPKLTVERFTVSYSLETIRYGAKSSHFVSVGFAMSDPDRDFNTHPISPEEFAVLQQDANKVVTIAAIHDAVARGALSQEDANDLITSFKTRQDGIKSVLSKKLNNET